MPEYTSQSLKKETLEVINRLQIQLEDQVGFLKANYQEIYRDSHTSKAARDVVESYKYLLQHPHDEAAKKLLEERLEIYMT